MKKNPVVHFEIYADDPDKLVKFYTSLFDWTVEPIPAMDYRLIKTVETDAKGMPPAGGRYQWWHHEAPRGLRGGMDQLCPRRIAGGSGRPGEKTRRHADERENAGAGSGLVCDTDRSPGESLCPLADGHEGKVGLNSL